MICPGQKELLKYVNELDAGKKAEYLKMLTGFEYDLIEGLYQRLIVSGKPA